MAPLPRRYASVTTALAALVGAAGLAPGAACIRPASPVHAPSNTERIAQAEAAVRRYFAAADAGDCATLMRMAGRAMDQAACDEFLDEHRRHQMHFQSIERSDIDGRDPNAVIVRTNVRGVGVPTRVLVRAELRGAAWRIWL